MRSWWTRVERLWRRSGSALIERARFAEAEGDLELATRLYIEAGSGQDTSRVLWARVQSALTGGERLKLLSLAIEHASEGQRRMLRQKHASLKLELCQARDLYLTRPELSELGRELLDLGEPHLAADAFGLAGDLDAQTSALVEAGAIERLEAVFDADESRQRLERDREQTTRNAIDLDRLGRRRAVLAVAADQPEASASRLGELSHRIKARRASGPVLRLELEAERRQFVLGSEVTLGRANAGIVVSSPAVSRRHLEFSRKEGVPALTDVSKNGTTLRGIALSGSVRVQSRIEVMLGGEVPVCVEPHERFGLALSVLQETFWLPLGDLELPVGRVLCAPDEWIELEPPQQGVYLNSVHVQGRVQLCYGDELRPAREGAWVARVLP